MNISVGTPAERKGLVPCSGIRRVLERTKTLKREAHPLVFLETRKPDFGIRLRIKEAAKRVLDAGRDHYMSDYEIPELRAAIAEKLKRDNGRTYDPETKTLVTAGTAEPIFDAFLGFLSSQDEVLIPEPSCLNCAAAARLAGAIPVPIPLREADAFQIDPDEAGRLLVSHNWTLVLVSPIIRPAPSGPQRPSGPRRSWPSGATSWWSPTRSTNESFTMLWSTSARRLTPAGANAPSMGPSGLSP